MPMGAAFMARTAEAAISVASEALGERSATSRRPRQTGECDLNDVVAAVPSCGNFEVAVGCRPLTTVAVVGIGDANCGFLRSAELARYWLKRLSVGCCLYRAYGGECKGTVFI